MTEDLSPYFLSLSLLPSVPPEHPSAALAAVSVVAVLRPAGVRGGLAFVAVQESGHDD